MIFMSENERRLAMDLIDAIPVWGQHAENLGKLRTAFRQANVIQAPDGPGKPDPAGKPGKPAPEKGRGR